MKPVDAAPAARRTRGWSRVLSERLRGNFQLALLTLFGLITVLGVTPFAVYRLATGQTWIGVLDLLIVLAIGTGVGHAWRTGRTGAAAVMSSLVYTAGCIAVAHLGGLSGVLWLYPVMLANFLLVGRRTAVVICAAAVVAVSLSGITLTGTVEKLMFVATSFVVSLFAFVFAARAEAQRMQLESIAAHDPLTGAFNRRGMHVELDIAIAGSRRSGSPLGLLMFDLDHFKRINDRYGHEAGDTVLVRVSHLVNASTRKGDRFFRMGGEEFGLLVPGVDAQSLGLIAEKLRKTVEEQATHASESITISTGATWYLPGEAASDLLARADAAMYRAKREGRNRVVLEPPPAMPLVQPDVIRMRSRS